MDYTVTLAVGLECSLRCPVNSRLDRVIFNWLQRTNTWTEVSQCVWQIIIMITFMRHQDRLCLTDFITFTVNESTQKIKEAIKPFKQQPPYGSLTSVVPQKPVRPECFQNMPVLHNIMKVGHLSTGTIGNCTPDNIMQPNTCIKVFKWAVQLLCESQHTWVKADNLCWWIVQVHCVYTQCGMCVDMTQAIFRDIFQTQDQLIGDGW